MEPERFSINEEARNFPKEAVERNLAEPDPAVTRRKRQAEDADPGGKKSFYDYGGTAGLFTLRLVLGAQKLTGENLKVVWAEFSTLS